jgi:hypothetical protein
VPTPDYTADAGTAGVASGGAGPFTQGAQGTSVDGTGTATAATSAVTSVAVKGVFTAASGGTTNTAATFEDNQTLAIKSAATAAHSVTVTAWLDADGSGTINNSEFASSPVTISFVEYDDAGLQIAMAAAPQLGDGTYKATVTSSIVNVAQIAVANVGVKAGIYVSGTKTAIDASGYAYATLADSALAANGVAVTLNSDKDALNTADVTVAYSSGGVQSTLIVGNYVAQAIYATDQDGTDWAVVGTEIAFGLGAAAADATESAETVTAVSGSVTAAGSVLKGYKGNITYVVNVLDSDEVAVVGKTVRLTVTTETGTFTVNGAAVASAGVYEATTDAAGNATYVFVSANGAATDALLIGAIVTEGVTIEALGDTTDIAYTAAVYTAKETTSVSQANNAVRAVDSGATHTISFVVSDQFGNSFADAAYRMKATVTGRTVTTVTDTLGDGAATFAIADGANTSGDTTVALSYEKLASGVWGTSTDITAVTNRVIKYYSQTNAVAVVETSETARHALKATKSGDTRDFGFTGTVFDSTGANSNETITLTGSVTNATSAAAQPGALVTVSGDSSLLFNVEGVYAFGSLTFYDADGTLAIKVYSNKVQANTVVTVTTADGGSDTVKVTFNGVATNAGTSLVISGADYVAAGSTMQISGLLTDVYGNAVNTSTVKDWDDSTTEDVGETATDFSVTVTGPGITLTTLPTTTDADGAFLVNRLLGTSDMSGTITITASYDQNDDGDYLDAGDLVVTKTITIGSAPVVSDTKVNVGSFKGYVALYAKGYAGQKMSAIVAGKWIVVASLASDFERVVRYTGAGYDIVATIYIDGVMIDTFNVLTK